MPYPTTIELQAYLTAHGVGSADLDRIEPLLDDALESAVAAWENATGYAPFLVDEDDPETTRTFGLRNAGVVEFGAGIIGEITYSSSMAYGELFVNPVFPERPAHALRIPYNCTNGTLGITGLWGACTTLPKGVKSAILSIAAASLTGAISGTAFTGGQITKEKVGEVETTYGSASSAGSSGDSPLATLARDLASPYRRPSSGIA